VVSSLLPKEDDSSRWVSTLAPLTLLKTVTQYAVTLNKNRMMYNVSDATKADMVTPPIVNFRLQNGGDKDYSMEGLMGVDTSEISGPRPSFNGDIMSCLTVQFFSSRPKKPYNSSTSSPKHQRKPRHLHQDCNTCSKLTNTSSAYTAGI